MTQVSDTSADQADFFAQGDELKHVAELCNALYERELDYLATYGPSQISLLRRKLKGLSHHIRRAAYHLASNDSPLDVDNHNASWQAKQSAKCPGSNIDKDKAADWFYRYAAPGLVVPVKVTLLDTHHIELDSVDRVDKTQHCVHLNKYGWFTTKGKPAEERADEQVLTVLMKPSKAIMTAACCGHAWSHKGRKTPRTLSLREMLLSTTINWKTFRL